MQRVVKKLIIYERDEIVNKKKTLVISQYNQFV